MKKKLISLVIVLSVLAVVLGGCAGGGATGKLQFYANGEDFVRQGFVSKDGWSITFDHVYITLSDIAAYQTEPPYEPASGTDIQPKATVALDGAYTVDLAEGDENASPLLVAEVSGVAAGHYNALAWKMSKAASGPTAGHALVMIGVAEKDGQVVNFNIQIDEECEYQCGEYVGDVRKGIVAEGSTADVQMTFHFDHIFGDGELPLDDELNLGAVGFQPFADGQAAADVIDMAEMHLGHVGEGHCHCGCH